ncbi:MAG: hypothetical protein JJU26_07100 [Oceanicaulis sp.]|uniref:hypothetical protein n=1 Tax=Glycocaulis sp. TaxID=1969725 RepID=UPI0025C4BDD6|nr:hypothetical protein [Glycocaulis sp.]MCC5981470.1 hypothetical protein [Oceanicaulis sp.]MCH8522342.1 hypothetical protein [Glycocaulis sp.]
MRFITLLAGLSALLAGLSACAPTTSGGMTSAFSAAPAPADFTPRDPSRPELSGYIAEGEGFWLELAFREAPDGGVEIDTIIDTGAAALLNPVLEMAEPWLAGGVRRFEGHTGRHGDVTLILQAGPCAIGGMRYGHFAMLEIAGRPYEGCARETGPHPLWTHEIGEFLPAIEACRADSAVSAVAHVRGAGQRRIVHARHDDGAVVVRFEYPGSGRFDCSHNGMRASWRAVSDTEPSRPGEGDPVFIPGTLPAPGDGCYLYERVVDGEGRLVGALAHDVCLPGAVS